MSATSAGAGTIPKPAGTPGNTRSLTPTLRASARRAVFWVIIAVVVLLIAVISALVTGGQAAGRVLAADNAAPNGARALVEVLRQQGVTVIPAGSLNEARSAVAAADDPTLFFFDADAYLDEAGLSELPAMAPRTVIAAPDFSVLQAVAPEVGFGGVATANPPSAECAVPAASRAGVVSPDGATLTIVPGTAPAGDTPVSLAGCFPTSTTAFSMVTRTEAGRTVTLVADTGPFSNDRISDYGNAALALNLLGEGSTVVWYLPTLADVPRTGAPSLGELTPGWVTPTLVLLGITFLAAAIWRGRRFGALVAENLPVTVKASETMEGRARLYARGNTRLRALDALRIGTAQRLARRVGLGRGARLEDIILSTASVTGLPAHHVRAVLVQEEPANDADLMRLSRELQQVEQAAETGTTPLHPVPEDPAAHGRMDT